MTTDELFLRISNDTGDELLDPSIPNDTYWWSFSFYTQCVYNWWLLSKRLVHRSTKLQKWFRKSDSRNHWLKLQPKNVFPENYKHWLKSRHFGKEFIMTLSRFCIFGGILGPFRGWMTSLVIRNFKISKIWWNHWLPRPKKRIPWKFQTKIAILGEIMTDFVYLGAFWAHFGGGWRH